MNSTDRANLFTLMAKHANAASKTKKIALATLVDEGIVDADGKLMPEYGGGEIKVIKPKSKVHNTK